MRRSPGPACGQAALHAAPIEAGRPAEGDAGTGKRQVRTAWPEEQIDEPRLRRYDSEVPWPDSERRLRPLRLDVPKAPRPRPGGVGTPAVTEANPINLSAPAAVNYLVMDKNDTTRIAAPKAIRAARIADLVGPLVLGAGKGARLRAWINGVLRMRFICLASLFALLAPAAGCTRAPRTVVVVRSNDPSVYITAVTDHAVSPADSDFTRFYAHLVVGRRSDRVLLLDGQYLQDTKVQWHGQSRVTFCNIAEGYTLLFRNEITLGVGRVSQTIRARLKDWCTGEAPAGRRTPRRP